MNGTTRGVLNSGKCNFVSMRNQGKADLAYLQIQIILSTVFPADHAHCSGEKEWLEGFQIWVDVHNSTENIVKEADVDFLSLDWGQVWEEICEFI